MERFNPLKRTKQEPKPLPVKTPDRPLKDDTWGKKRPMIRTPRDGKR